MQDREVTGAGGDAVQRLRHALRPPAEELLAEYFDREGTFAGETFDRFGTNDPCQLGPDDLLAVSKLDVSIKPLGLRRMLGHEADAISRALSQLPTNIDLWAADKPTLNAADTADDLLRRFEGVGPVVASKLLSRKRPRLTPVIDSVVLAQLGQPRDAYKTTRRALALRLGEDDLQARVRELTARLPDGISPIRALDVVLWMRGSGSRTARMARVRHGHSRGMHPLVSTGGRSDRQNGGHQHRRTGQKSTHLGLPD